MARTYDHPEVGTLTLPASSLLFAQTKTQDVGPAPTLGQHTAEILKAAGYDDAALEELRSRKVIR
jgi:formyl-CoA transferase